MKSARSLFFTSRHIDCLIFGLRTHSWVRIQNVYVCLHFCCCCWSLSAVLNFVVFLVRSSDYVFAICSSIYSSTIHLSYIFFSIFRFCCRWCFDMFGSVFVFLASFVICPPLFRTLNVKCESTSLDLSYWSNKVHIKRILCKTFF